MLMLLSLLAGPALAKEQLDFSPDLQDPAIRERAQLDILAGLIAAGMIDDALSTAGQLRADGLKSPELDLLQAAAMHQRSMSDQAMQMTEAVTKKHPRMAGAWSQLGLMRADLDDIDGAIDALERARRLEPESPKVLNNLGYLHMAQGRSQRAVELFESALMADPSNPRTRNNLGFALARLERDIDALKAFRAAGPESDARYNMGVACELRGDTASALNNYRAALEVAPTHAHALIALDRLLHPESK